jgi:hypothetical protein
MNPVISIPAYASLGLQAALLVFLLLRGHFHRYPLLTVYCVVFLAATVAELAVLNAVGTKGAAYRYLYMADEVIIDFLLFLMVIRMTYRALAGNPFRGKIERFLKVALICTVLLPFVLFRGPILGSHWFNQACQLLNFGAAVMNLALWTALLGNPKRDPLLLAVSAGLGVAVTGAAITYGLHYFRWSTNGTARDLVDLIKSFAYIASLLIWCRAFWPVRLSKPAHAATYPLALPRQAGRDENC